MNPVGAIRDEQWAVCDRCGRYRPMSMLTRQEGLLVCTYKNSCHDDLTVKRRDSIIANKLESYSETEQVDMRWVNDAFANVPEDVEF